MNILKFAKYALNNPKEYRLRTSSGRWININSISESDPYPISGEIVDAVPGHNSVCQWDENGRPHNLPCNHGLEIHPFMAETVWNKINADVFKKATNAWDLYQIDT